MCDKSRTTATKVILPLVKTDLRAGGQSFFIGEERSAHILETFFSDNPGLVREDLAILEILDDIPSMDPFLNDLVNDLKADAALKVRLVGHTDATELERTRVRPVLAELGKERAAAVRDALVEAGIDAGRITVVGKAADDAADTTGTEIGMSKNRRVEVELQ